MDSKKLGFFKLTSNAYAPIKMSAFAAGFDLKSAQNVIVPKNGKQLIKTDLILSIPDGCYGRIAPRSGLALNNFIDVGAGVIDRDYRGNVQILLFNHSSDDFIVNKGDRIAQLICEKISYPELHEMNCLESTERNSSGFGSTGR